MVRQRSPKPPLCGEHHELFELRDPPGESIKSIDGRRAAQFGFWPRPIQATVRQVLARAVADGKVPTDWPSYASFIAGYARSRLWFRVSIMWPSP